MPYVDKQRLYASQASHRLKNQQALRAYLLTHPCIQCGENDPIVLTFDHRDNVEKKFEIGRAVAGSTRSWKSILAEISKCDVLCANCHLRRTAKQFSWYKYLALVD